MTTTTRLTTDQLVRWAETNARSCDGDDSAPFVCANGDTWRQVAEIIRAAGRMTPLHVHLLSRYLEMACSCGVVTRDDQTDWAAAVACVPELLESLKALTAE